MLKYCLLFSCFIHGLLCLVFKAPGKLDYVSAVNYCDKMNSMVTKFDEAVTARNKCMLYYTDVWYVRPDGYPKHDKKEGYCYVHGSYWIPCKEKAWFFCDDGGNNTQEIDCEPNGIPTGGLKDDDYYTKPVSEKSIGNQGKPTIALNMYEWMVVGGTGLICALLTFAITFALLKRQFRKKMALEQQYMSMEPTRAGHRLSAIDSKWYEETKAMQKGAQQFGNGPPKEKPPIPPNKASIYDETCVKLTSDIQLPDEPPHIYERADKLKLKSQTMPVQIRDIVHTHANESAYTLPYLDAANSDLPPTYEQAGKRNNYKRSLSVPSPHNETTNNIAFFEHQYSETAKNENSTESDIKESNNVGYESTNRPDPRFTTPYDTIYKQWEDEERRLLN